MSRGTGIGLARQFRKEPTPTEAAMWEVLRDRKLGGLEFRRQHPLGGIIADLYCAEASLLVELDGAVHLTTDQQEYDAARDAEVQSRGLQLVRFTNDEIEQDLPRVLERILTLADRSKAPIPGPSPSEMERGARVPTEWVEAG